MRSKEQRRAKAIQDEKRVHERMLFFLCAGLIVFCLNSYKPRSLVGTSH